MIRDEPNLPVFPLPGVVLFPRTVLPLHIFELRYRLMLSEVLDSHGLIAMARATPEGELDDDSRWKISEVVGVGRVADYRKNEDGTSEIALLGEARARVIEWREGKPFRLAKVAFLKDVKIRSTVLRDRLKAELVSHLLTLLDRNGPLEEKERLTQAFARETDVGFLADFISFRFLNDPDDRQVMLEEIDVAKRVGHLRDFLSLRGLI